jgi:CheY-like chemotaxis protein
MPARNPASAQLTALLIAPGRALAHVFTTSVAASRAFQILAELKSYPSQQVLEMRLRQLQPEMVLLDLETDLERACELIRFIVASSPAIHVVGLHGRNDSEAILRSPANSCTRRSRRPSRSRRWSASGGSWGRARRRRGRWEKCCCSRAPSRAAEPRR